MSQKDGPGPGAAGGSGGNGGHEEEKKDNFEIFFSENWKQQVMVKPDAKLKGLTSMTLGLEMLSAVAFLMMAGGNVSRLN